MAAALRNTLPSGYDEEFLNAVEEDLQCLICHLPLKEPVLTRCGHRFCKHCLQEHFKRQVNHSQPSSCPADREKLNQKQDVFPDKATERKILSLAIKCPTESCGWTGELRNREDHLASCPWKLVQCTNQNCQVTVQRRNLKRHVTSCHWKTITCEHCNELHPKCQMKDHVGQCTKYPISCPNNCGHSISRQKLSHHTTNDCPLALICCPYEEMGCKRKAQRQKMESHLRSNVKPHLDLACAKLETRVFTWKVKEFSKRLRQAQTGEMPFTTSIPFYTDRTESYGYKIKVRIDPNGAGSSKNTHLSVYIIVMKGEYDPILPWPFKKKVKFTLIDQQEDPAERENVASQFTPIDYPESFARPKLEENTGHGYAKFISHEKLHSRRYLVDDNLFLQVEIGPSAR